MKKIDWLKISKLIKNQQFLSNQADIQAILLTHELVVDSLGIAKFWASLFLHQSLFKILTPVLWLCESCWYFVMSCLIAFKSQSQILWKKWVLTNTTLTFGLASNFVWKLILCVFEKGMRIIKRRRKRKETIVVLSIVTIEQDLTGVTIFHSFKCFENLTLNRQKYG